MYSNVSTAIDKFLADVLQQEDVVQDLEPVRVRILRVEPRAPDTEPTTVEKIDLTIDEFEEVMRPSS